MLCTTYSRFCVVLVFGFILTVTMGEHSPEDMKECKKVTRKTIKQILKELGVCNSEMKAKTKSMEEHSRKMGCVIRCVLGKEEMLDEHGLVTNETLVRAVANRAEEKWKNIVLHLFQDCVVKYGKDLAPNDEFCGGYSLFGSCIQNSVADMCHVDIPF